MPGENHSFMICSSNLFIYFLNACPNWGASYKPTNIVYALENAIQPILLEWKLRLLSWCLKSISVAQAVYFSKMDISLTKEMI